MRENLTYGSRRQGMETRTLQSQAPFLDPTSGQAPRRANRLRITIHWLGGSIKDEQNRTSDKDYEKIHL